MALEEFLNCRNNITAPRVHFGIFYKSLLGYNFLVAILAFFLYCYILLCYCYRSRLGSILNQGQWLIVGVCCGVLTSCCSTITSNVFRRWVHVTSTENKEIFSSVLFSIHFHFGVNNSFFLTTLLSAYRYYCICKPVVDYIRVFSSKRIRNYILLYLLSGVFMVCLKEGFRYLNSNSCSTIVFCVVYFSLLNIYYLICLFATTYFHVKASSKLGGNIRRERKILRKNPGTYFDNSSDEFRYQYSSRAEYYISREQETFREEIHYLKTIRIYAIVFTPILALKYIFWLILSYNGLVHDTYFSPDTFGVISGKFDLIIYALLDTLLKMNFVFFLQVNEDFKLRLLRPWRFLDRYSKLNLNPPKMWKDIEKEPIIKITAKYPLSTQGQLAK